MRSNDKILEAAQPKYPKNLCVQLHLANRVPGFIDLYFVQPCQLGSFLPELIINDVHSFSVVCDDTGPKHFGF